ncbi:uncharacterized protein LOC123538504 [Mercenaria mercenaria]|uniref:uncharacterized protein LOC123538504 n=1 Tax=Mercenaria mercenaria TaxID=6596 RepID=UPI00234F968D|nr:uncharacterized protein LOC123538504 [Mercenaria mercenaria]
MAWIKYFRILSISALVICANCNVIRQGKAVNDKILLSDVNAEDNDMFVDNDVKEENNYIHLHESLGLSIKDTKTNGNAYNHDKITLVHHFARHALCRNIEGKARFYTAMKSKLCNSNSKFIAHLIDDICSSNNSHLDNWVAELFDLNEDGFVDHFERHFYKTDD